VPALDASVTFDETTGQAAAFLVNRDITTELDVELRLADRRAVQVTGIDVLGGGDPKAANTWEQPDRVRPRAGRATVNDAGAVTTRLPAPGFAAVRFTTEAR
jgi:alpha-N-arabinofuranosidase